VTPSGEVVAQSRTQVLTLPSGDFKGFAAWALQHTDYFRAMAEGLGRTITLFGEWCGPGVEKKAAIAKHDRKVWALFAVQLGDEEDAEVIYDPEKISGFVHRNTLQARVPSGLYILPWFDPAPGSGGVLTLNYAHQGVMDQVVSLINASVERVEAEDPWVKEVFGISGVGEGLVFYPVGEHASTNPERLSRTMFKAKGLKHAKVKTKNPVEIDPEVVKSVDGFVDHMVTGNRLEQGLTEACGGEAHMRHTRAFIQWVSDDVQKESEAELEAAGLAWKQVQKAVQAKARTWLREQVSG
jgi:hypothetical protein